MTQAAAFGGVPFSSRVRLWLEFGQSRIPLSHVEPGCVIAWKPIDLEPGDGAVVVCVEDQVYRTAVTLTFGMRADEPETLIRPHDSIPI